MGEFPSVRCPDPRLPHSQFVWLPGGFFGWYFYPDLGEPNIMMMMMMMMIMMELVVAYSFPNKYN